MTLPSTPRIIAAAIIVAIIAAACGGSPNDAGSAAPTAAPEPTRETAEATPEPTGDIMEVEVGPELQDCVGMMPMKCMMVDGGLFYEPIEGFEHEAGYSYRLRIERYDPWEGKEVPQDASQYNYRLIEVISKTRGP